METSTLRPGLLVSMKTSLEGNVSYRKKDIERPHRTEEGAQRAKWETVRTIRDPAEHDRAVKTRSKIRNTVASVCAQSDFGLLCTMDNSAKLDRAVEKAKQIAKEFNETSQITKVNFYIMTGRIAPDDAEAIRAIRSEVAGLIGTMTDGLKKLDVKAVREAASKARGVATMLSEANAEKVNDAIAKARSAARKLVKAGDAAAVELDYAVIQGLQEARTAFLDVEAKPADVAAPVAETPALDVEAEAPKTAEVDPSPLADIDVVVPDLELSENA